tara:strand:+ start:467 stop:1786 length:1320 start_codon:yes stop_codon:yes gene_type:complete
MKKKLALFGGKKTIKNALMPYSSIGKDEERAALKVVKKKVLSNFIGSYEKDFRGNSFYGGNYVKKFERLFEKKFKIKHAVSVNSWTSGLTIAVASLDISPGDEIIVTPWTMTATVAAILHNNAIPVFVDIDKKTYNIDPMLIEKKITNRTKAILAVDIFGQSCDVKKLLKISKKHNIKLITDSAQSPGVNNELGITGTKSHIGGFSFNCHKHVQCGEGGIIVTNDTKIYNKLLLLRNHGEVVIDNPKFKVNKNLLTNLIGYNYRLSEIHAAIACEQVKKINYYVKDRQRVAKVLFKGLKNLNGLELPYIAKKNSHAFYIFPINLKIDSLPNGITRKKIVAALLAEGVTGLSEGYSNLHKLKLFKKKIAYGKKGFPWKIGKKLNKINYNKICPNAEYLHEKSFITFELCLNKFTNYEINLVCKAFHKVWNNFDVLKKIKY